jgi:hypothetical protein|tara:strand:+ start:229 stop:453 length:225 start_codon:yes stop_codon:yes gene_type:complete
MKNKVQIFIDKKEILYTHSNIVHTINAFLPYLTNTDLDELINRICAMKEHRLEQEKLSIEECKHIPIQKNRHDT